MQALGSSSDAEHSRHSKDNAASILPRQTHIPTKLGQPSSSSPRTESRRQRFTGLFSTLSLTSNAALQDVTSPSKPARPEPSVVSTRGSGSRGPGVPGILGWLLPSMGAPSGAQRTETSGLATIKSVPGFIQQGAEGINQNTECLLTRLPDELIIKILSHLPPNASTLLTVSLVNKHFQALSQSPILWSRIFHSQPGFVLIPNIKSRLQATTTPPEGKWREHEWLSSSTNPPRIDSSPIPIHYPTLYRSRLALHAQLHSRSKIHNPTIQRLDAHSDIVYCAHLSHPWIITGSRDRTIRFWYISRVTGNVELKETVEDAHAGSVLSVKMEGGLMLSASSDMTVIVWDVKLDDVEGIAEVKAKETLTGHTSGVLDVVFAKHTIISSSKDTTIRIYNRETFRHMQTISHHREAVNSLALGYINGIECVASASGDGVWCIWDIETGKKSRRGGGDSSGLACIAWSGEYIVTGCNDHKVRLYNSSDGVLRKEFSGHAHLVRTVAIDPMNGLVISGSYDYAVRIWDLHTGNEVRVIEGDDASHVMGVAVERGRIASVSHNELLEVITFGLTLPYRNLFA